MLVAWSTWTQWPRCFSELFWYNTLWCPCNGRKPRPLTPFGLPILAISSSIAIILLFTSCIFLSLPCPLVPPSYSLLPVSYSFPTCFLMMCVLPACLSPLHIPPSLHRYGHLWARACHWQDDAGSLWYLSEGGQDPGTPQAQRQVSVWAAQPQSVTLCAIITHSVVMLAHCEIVHALYRWCIQVTLTYCACFCSSAHDMSVVCCCMLSIVKVGL